jgi:hypothetical protein
MTAATLEQTLDTFAFPGSFDADTRERLERAHQTQCGRVHVFSSGYRIDAPYVWTPQFSWCNAVTVSSVLDGVETQHHMSYPEWRAIQPDPRRQPVRDSIDPDEFTDDDCEHAELLFRRSDPNTKRTLTGRNPGRLWQDED